MSRGRKILAGSVWAAAYLWSLECVVLTALRIAVGHDTPALFISPVAYGLTIWSATLAVSLTHLLPLVWLAGAPGRDPKRVLFLRCALGAAFGFMWQRTISGGAGIAAHPLAPYIRTALALGVPFGCAFVVWWLSAARRPGVEVRRWMTAGALLLSSLANLGMLTDYRAFHAYLAMANAALFLYLSWPLLGSVWAFRLAVGGIAISMLSFLPFAPTMRQAQGHVVRVSKLAGVLVTNSPLLAPCLLPPESFVDLSGVQPPRIAHDAPPARSAPAVARGNNVLLFVLEATRAQEWANPEIAPRFARLRRGGLFVPNAVANYPATILAYASMFTSQYPSVLFATTYWRSERLFDGIRSRFDALFLSKPSTGWFDGSTVTGFFLADGEPVARHGSAREGLDRLRQQLADLPAGQRFFSWMHLFEPHSPWTCREPFARDDTPLACYRSEVSAMDEELGRFMDWFATLESAEQTLVLIVADHGEGLGESVDGEPIWHHGYHLNERYTRIPFFASGPGLPRGVRDESLPVGQIDLMPTLYDFVGVRLPERFRVQGESLYALLQQRPQRVLVSEQYSLPPDLLDSTLFPTEARSAAEQREVFSAFAVDTQIVSQVAIRRGRDKMLYDRAMFRTRLFDLARDPDELDNLALREPARLEHMQWELRRWLQLQAQTIYGLGERADQRDSSRHRVAVDRLERPR